MNICLNCGGFTPNEEDVFCSDECYREFQKWSTVDYSALLVGGRFSIV